MQAFGGDAGAGFRGVLESAGSDEGHAVGEAVGWVDGQFAFEAEVTLGVRLGGV